MRNRLKIAAIFSVLTTSGSHSLAQARCAPEVPGPNQDLTPAVEANLSLLALAVPSSSVPKKSFQATLTYYAAMSESEWAPQGAQKLSFETAEYFVDTPSGRKGPYRAEFLNGFTGRDSVNPYNSDISGVAMEGSGTIDPKFHRADPTLTKFLNQGLTTLSLDRWDPIKKKATFFLSKNALGSNDDPLIPWKSAAIKQPNKKIPMHSWVRISAPDGTVLDYRYISDECSSCKNETDIDLYVPTGVKIDEFDDKKFTTEVLPKGFKPPKDFKSKFRK